MKKIISLLIMVVLLLCTVSCSKGDTKNVKQTQVNEDEINKKYEEYFGNDSEDKPLGSDASVLGEDFSDVDFTFTSPDDTIAYTIGKNSFVKIDYSGTLFDTAAYGNEPMTFDIGFKTARGASLDNSAAEVLAKYKIGDLNALYISPGEDVLRNPSNGIFNGKATAIFASVDSQSYSLLSSGDVQNFIYTRNANADGNHINTEAVMNVFSEYESLVSVDITADEAGNISEIVIYRLDK